MRDTFLVDGTSTQYDRQCSLLFYGRLHTSHILARPSFHYWPHLSPVGQHKALKLAVNARSGDGNQSLRPHVNSPNQLAPLAFQLCHTETFAVVNCCLFSRVSGTNRQPPNVWLVTVDTNSPPYLRGASQLRGLTPHLRDPQPERERVSYGGELAVGRIGGKSRRHSTSLLELSSWPVTRMSE